VKERKETMPKFLVTIGYPLKHTVAPYFQQAALDYYQLDIRYEAWETRPEDLESTVAKFKEPQILGAKVTVPYKEVVIPLLDQIDEQASVIGAVSAILKEDNKLCGSNHDAPGFMEALRKEGKFEPKGKKVVIVGAGGAARAVTFALVREKAGTVLIVNRTLERAEALAGSLKSYISQAGLQTGVAALPWQSLSSRDTFSQCHLIVNCTTMGMKHSAQEGQSPLNVEVIPKGILVYDVVYNPLITPLLQLARQAGANIVRGLAMLVYQGVVSFEIFTGKKAPVELMFAKAEEALTGKAKSAK
jgi:shikimate dehydrogenase